MCLGVLISFETMNTHYLQMLQPFLYAFVVLTRTSVTLLQMYNYFEDMLLPQKQIETAAFLFRIDASNFD